MEHGSAEKEGESDVADELAEGRGLRGLARLLHVISVIGLTLTGVAWFTFRGHGLDYLIATVFGLFLLLLVANMLLNRRIAGTDTIETTSNMHRTQMDDHSDFDDL